MRYRIAFKYLLFRKNVGFAGRGTIALTDIALLISGTIPMFGLQISSLFPDGNLLLPTIRTVPYTRISAYISGRRIHKLAYTLPQGKRVIIAFRFLERNGRDFAAKLEEYRLTMRSLYPEG